MWQSRTIRRSGSVAKTNLDCDWIAEQRFVERDGAVDHCLDRRGVLIVSDGAVEAGVNNQSRRRHRGSRHDFRVTACACHTISPDSVVIGLYRDSTRSPLAR